MSDSGTGDEMEAQIAVHRQEEHYSYSPTRFMSQASETNSNIYEWFSLDHLPACLKPMPPFLPGTNIGPIWL